MAGKAIITFVGLIAGMFLAFIGKILFARFFTPAEYGIFSLGLSIIGISAGIGTLGLRSGATRQISYNVGKKDQKRIDSIIKCSLFLSIISGTVISIIVFFSSDLISLIFDMPLLSTPLKLLSIAIPFYVIIEVLSSMFRGFGKVRQHIYFKHILLNILFIILLVPVILLNVTYRWGIVSYTVSICVVGIIFYLYFVKGKSINYQSIRNNRITLSCIKELLFFSLPLLVILFLNQFMGWADTIMLGYFKNAESVGLYNAAYPLALIITVVMTAVIFIFTPVASKLYAQNNISAFRKCYAVLTKWACSVIFPAVLIFLLFPKIVLNFIFGAEYISSAMVLQILALGYFIHILLGPNGSALTALGKTKFMMWSTLVAIILNIILNGIFIPKYGIIGAAIATITSRVFLGGINSIKLYHNYQIHSLKKNLVIPTLLSGISFFIIYLTVKNFINITYWMIPFLFIISIFIYMFILIITKNFNQDDIKMLLLIEKKVGIDFKRIKNLLKRFI